MEFWRCGLGNPADNGGAEVPEELLDSGFTVSELSQLEAVGVRLPEEMFSSEK